MPDPLHLKQLCEALKDPLGRKEWLTFKLNAPWIDLSTADFTDVDLRDFDLSDCNLSTTILLGANLSGVDLSDATLNFADMRRCSLRNAVLDRADLRSANLHEAEVIDACLEGSNLKGCKLSGANMIGADLSGADLTGADLRGASLKYARLTGAILDDANVADADLTGAVLDDDAPSRLKHFDAAVIDDRKYREMRCRLSAPAPPVIRAGPPEEREGPPAAGTAAMLEGDETIAAPAPEAEVDDSGGPAFIPLRTVEPDLSSTRGCCALLGLGVGATKGQVVKAFRRKAKVFHPDRVGHLGPRLQQLAADEFMRLHRAYEFLTRKTTRPLRRIIWPEAMARDLSPHEYSVSDYEELIALNPENSDVLYNLAWKYFEAGRHEESRRRFEQVLERAPEDEDTKYNLIIVKLSIELALPGCTGT